MPKQQTTRSTADAIHGVLLGLFVACLAATLICGCTATSTKLAMEGSTRSDAIRTAVSQRQHDGLKVLLYRDTLAKLNACKDDGERAAALNAAWNDRDLIEFWATQDALARCLHVATVDAKLASDQAMLDLLLKDLARRAEKPLQAIDEYAAAKLAEGLLQPQEDASGKTP